MHSLQPFKSFELFNFNSKYLHARSDLRAGWKKFIPTMKALCHEYTIAYDTWAIFCTALSWICEGSLTSLWAYGPQGCLGWSAGCWRTMHWGTGLQSRKPSPPWWLEWAVQWIQTFLPKQEIGQRTTTLKLCNFLVYLAKGVRLFFLKFKLSFCIKSIINCNHNTDTPTQKNTIFDPVAITAFYYIRLLI